MSFQSSSALMSSSKTASSWGSYTIEHLPENPEDLPNVKKGFELLDEAQMPKHAKIAYSIYRSAWDLLSPVYEAVKKKTDAFPLLWGNFFANVANCLVPLKHLEAAEQCHMSFLTIGSQDASQREKMTRFFFRSLGEALESQGEYQLALKKYERGIQLGGHSFSLHFRRYFILCENLGQPEESIGDLLQAEKCFRASPKNVTGIGLYHLGLYYKNVSFSTSAAYFKQASAQFLEEHNDDGVKNCYQQLPKVEKLKNIVAAAHPMMTNYSSARFAEALAAARSYEDHYIRALIYEKGKRLMDAYFFVVRAKKLAKSDEEGQEIAFLKEAIRRALPKEDRLLLPVFIEAEKNNRKGSQRDSANYSYNIAKYYLSKQNLKNAEFYATMALKKYEQKKSQEDCEDCRELLKAIAAENQKRAKAIQSTASRLIEKPREATPSSWLPTLFARYKAAKSYKDIYALAMSYKSEGDLVDAYICFGKAKDLAATAPEKSVVDALMKNIKRELLQRDPNFADVSSSKVPAEVVAVTSSSALSSAAASASSSLLS